MHQEMEPATSTGLASAVVGSEEQFADPICNAQLSCLWHIEACSIKLPPKKKTSKTLLEHRACQTALHAELQQAQGWQMQVSCNAMQVGVQGRL